MLFPQRADRSPLDDTSEFKKLLVEGSKLPLSFNDLAIMILGSFIDLDDILHELGPLSLLLFVHLDSGFFNIFKVLVQGLYVELLLLVLAEQQLSHHLHLIWQGLL